jgi:hypothetical protein
MKPYIKVAIFLVFFIAIGGILAALYLYNLKPKNLVNTKPDYITSASDLQKSFEESEKISSGKYINKIIEVSGEILSARGGEKNSFNVSLKTGNDLSSVICTFPAISDSTLLKPGNVVTIRGVCSGFLMDVLLNNCALIKKQI